MKDVFQVVFLIDLDCISNCTTNRTTLCSKIANLTRVLLKFLTFYATRECVSAATVPSSSVSSNDGSCDNSYSYLKWGYKYYFSSQKKPVRQQCAFKDFNRESFEQFERELEDKLLHRLSEVSNVQQCNMTLRSASVGVQVPLHQSSASCGRIPAETLERALKELLIDYPWDTPHLSSPVRWTRRQLAGFSKDALESETVKNIVLTVTEAPKSHHELEIFLGRSEKENIVEKNKDSKITASTVLDSILPQNVRQKFCSVAKIQLLWLDVSESRTLSINQSHSATADNNSAHKLVHQALTKIGGALIPWNSVVPFHWLSEQRKCIDANAAFTMNYPEALEFNIPFTALMESFSTADSHFEKNQMYPNCAHLHLPHGLRKTLICNMELLRLFQQNSRSGMSHKLSCQVLKTMHLSHSSSSRQMVVFENDSSKLAICSTNITECKAQKCRQQPPQNLHPVGAIYMQDVHNLLIARPVVYVCFSKNKETLSKENNGSLQNVLMELAVKEMALVVSCDDLYQGILFPANRRCHAALLYILNYDDQFLMLMENCLNSPIPDEMNNFVCQLLKNWETSVIDFSQSKIHMKPSTKRAPVLSPTYLEKWFQVNHCDRTLMNVITLNSNYATVFGEQQRLFQELQKSYIPSVSETHETTTHLQCEAERSIKKQMDPIKRLHSTSEDSLNNECITVGKKYTSVKPDTTNSEAVSLKDEDELISILKTMYDTAVSSDNNLLTAAKMLIKSALLFYTNCQSTKNAKVKTMNIIEHHLFLKPGSIIEKHTNMSESNKKIRGREHCLQSLIRLEIIRILPTETKSCLEEITAHLRMLSFVAGTSMLSSFLKESIVDNYYKLCKQTVIEICEDLNQPLPESELCLSPCTSTSSCFSPEKEMGIAPVSLISQMSIMSTTSSSSNHSRSLKLQRSDSLIRHPSFDLSTKRQIAIPHQRNSKDSRVAYTGCITRSVEKKNGRTGLERTDRKHSHRSISRHGFPATNKHVTPAKRKKPTTPQGHHVLRTKKVAETPVHKQVSQAMLKKQLLKRKRTLEDDDDDVIVEESPDKQPGFVLRRSPRRHASSLQRQSSFYSAFQAPPKCIQDIQQVTSQKQDINKLVLSFPLTISERKSKAKRHLRLDCLSPNRGTSKHKTPQKEKESVKVPEVRRSPRCHPFADRHKKQELQVFHKDQGANRLSPLKLCDDQAGQLLSPVFRRSTRNNTSNSSTPNDSAQKLGESHPKETFLSLQKTPKSGSFKIQAACPRKKATPKKCRVARKLLQTPSKNTTDTLEYIPCKRQTCDADIRIVSTPIKNGLQSPNTLVSNPLKRKKGDMDGRIESTPVMNGMPSPELLSFNTFTFGPLCGDFDSSSASSSPRIPLLYDENIVFDYNEQENFDSLQFLDDAINSEPFGDVIASPEHCSIGNAILSSFCQKEPNLDNLKTNHQAHTETDGNLIRSSSNLNSRHAPCSLGNVCQATEDLVASHSGNSTQAATLESLSKQACYKQSDTNRLSSVSFSDTLLLENTDTPGKITKTIWEKNEAFLDDCPSQRFTRQSSKELGISLDIFKQLSVDLSNVPTKANNFNYNAAPTSKQCGTSAKPHLRTLRSKHKLTSPNATSILHLTTSPLITQVSRYSLRSKK